MRRILKIIAKPAFIFCLGCVLYLIATNVGAGWLYVVVAAMGALTLVSMPLPWWSVRGVEVTRRAPVVATAGEPFECSLEIENTGRLTRYLLEAEDRFAGDAGRALAVRVRRVEPVRYTVENPRRGIYSGGDIIIESRGPFGLFYGRRRTWAASDTVVYPRTFEVAGLPLPWVADAERGDSSESSTLHRGHGGEFWGVREYRPGDPARLVAWKKSARGLLSGKLAVVELAREIHPPFVLAMRLDADAPPAATEMVISAGASLLVYGLGEGREVRAHAGPDNPPFPEEPDPDKILTWCASLRASRPPDPSDASVEIGPSTRGFDRLSRSHGAVVLVSCHEFAGPGLWMSPEEEREFIERAESAGRRVAWLGADVAEPWMI
ncbi:MAG TPA: DUF58 domain-containing protein [Rubrobacter sp.]|nr:DUF58 domain-containing protein [Rubrobacter sp.]